MQVSVFDLFSIGIGPSSSHTVGPMRAARRFVSEHPTALSTVHGLEIELFGSLAHTADGHGTIKAILLGLTGYQPATITTEQIHDTQTYIMQHKQVTLLQQHAISFDPQQAIIRHLNQVLPQHSNAMRFSSFDSQQQLLTQSTYFSIGGGFIVRHDEIEQSAPTATTTQSVPYPFDDCQTLLTHCHQQKATIAEIIHQNERTWHDEQTITRKLHHIANVMQNCIQRGCQSDGTLPGGLQVKRRAPAIYRELQQQTQPNLSAGMDSMNWLNCYAMAVNEENAMGGQVVTAPTNGAAGIIPAVMQYYLDFTPDHKPDALNTFLLTAAAIGMLYKKGASISGAEVGCQGEVGVASSMAAAALTAVLGGHAKQIENAAEIAMEHHLGMTCDPVGGLVQIPCIERNAMGAVKAVNAARIALLGEGDHKVSLDQVIRTMRQTGQDMNSIYKETSQGGLAVNVPEC